VTEIVGGLMMVSGGGMMLGAGLRLAQPVRFVAELLAVLPSTPLPPPDPKLDELVASID
jgi:hypothetical protein